MNCVILDVDGTLLDTRKPKAGEKTNIKFKDGEKYVVNFRPCLYEFLGLLRKKFDYVGIWSAGSKEYIDKIEKMIEFEFDFVWNFEQCEKVIGKNDDYEIQKPIMKILLEDDRITEESIVLIDDRIEVAHDYRSNHIQVNEFTGDEDDRELCDLYTFILENYKKDSDIRILASKWNLKKQL